MTSQTTVEAGISFKWEPDRSSATVDEYYAHGLSFQFSGIDESEDPYSGAFDAVMVGREYRMDPADGFEYGLWNNVFEHGVEGWLIRFGFAPDETGSTEGSRTYTHADGPIPASYVELVFDPQTEIAVENMTVQFQIGPEDNTIYDQGGFWAGLSVDDYQRVAMRNIEFLDDGFTQQVTFSFGDMIYDAADGDPLSVRVWGFMGADEGTFASAINFTADPIEPLPEPSSALFALVGGALLLSRRRARAFAGRRV
ncbi:MAG: hypothetical protein R3F11_21720 [Verrucomicrobiales bacterium]